MGKLTNSYPDCKTGSLITEDRTEDGVSFHFLSYPTIQFRLRERTGGDVGSTNPVSLTNGTHPSLLRLEESEKSDGTKTNMIEILPHFVNQKVKMSPERTELERSNRNDSDTSFLKNTSPRMSKETLKSI